MNTMIIFIFFYFSIFFFFFFFSSRRRHTRFDCDWSSDVCSSDLLRSAVREARPRATDGAVPAGDAARATVQIGRASCREKSVDLGGRRIIKKKKKRNRKKEK